MDADTQAHRIPVHDIETLKLCVAAAWFHGSISACRAYELGRTLRCPHSEIDALQASVAWEAAEK